MNSSSVIVLAAGEGTRLRPYTEILPKALFPVGDKPCIRWIVDDLLEQKFDNINICVNANDIGLFKHEFQFVTHNNEGICFTLSDRPLGTCGEVINCSKLNNIKWPILVVYADDLTYTKYESMFETHTIAVEEGFVGTLGVTTHNKLEVGLLKDEYGKITEFYEKPDVGQFGWTSWTGRAIFEKEILSYMRTGEDIAINVFPQLLNRLYAYKSENEWLDIGNIVHYTRANEKAKKGNLW